MVIAEGTFVLLEWSGYHVIIEYLEGCKRMGGKVTRRYCIRYLQGLPPHSLASNAVASGSPRRKADCGTCRFSLASPATSPSPGWVTRASDSDSPSQRSRQGRYSS